MSECKAWQGGCSDARAAGWNDLIRLLARTDGCCPPPHIRDDTCPGYDVEPGNKGLSCDQCWTDYIEGLT